MNDLLKNKVAVVTGAGRGIGAAIAEKLGEFGASVIVTDINAVLAEKVAASISAKYSLAKHHYFDVSDFSNIQSTIERLRSLCGRIDIWVNNAGITATQRVEDITEEQWDRIQDINLKGLFFCTQSIFKIMKEQKYGRIVHISSMAGVR
jgi:NAD(P)-dependent dehydrogenase (short-subunit alcohol dehydrogenase family)